MYPTGSQTSDNARVSKDQMLADKKILAEAIHSGQMPLHYAAPPEPQIIEPYPEGDTDFEPCAFFFYGTLMDPQVLMVIAMLDDLPDLSNAWVQGYDMKLWNGTYPTLLPRPDARDRIVGKVWRATSIAQCLRLQRYETSAYESADCDIHLESGEVVKGLTFTWARDVASEELSDGRFDLKHWQEHHKKPLF